METQLPAERAPIDAPIGQAAGHLVGVCCQIAASTDAEAVQVFLTSREYSPRTLEAYRREARRFLVWCSAQGKSFRSLTLNDVRGYLDFLKAPPPDLISARKFPNSDPRWRAFARPMVGQSAYYSLRFVKHLLAWLGSAQYLPFDPAAALRLRRPKPSKTVTRYLPREGIDLLLEAADMMPAGTQADQFLRARARFLVVLLYRTALRLSEVVTATMGDIQQDYAGDWWIYVRGKGRNDADEPDRVPVPPILMAELSKYRRLLGCSPEPSPDENIPLIGRARGHGRTTTRIVAHILATMAQHAATLADGRDNLTLGRALRSVTPHWLRHSYLSHLVAAGADIRKVADIARHGSIATTGGYSHAESKALQELVRGFDGGG